MPGPFRRSMTHSIRLSILGFNLRRDARPLSAKLLLSQEPAFYAFQSQTRCQAPFGVSLLVQSKSSSEVSISDEMPGPFRQRSTRSMDTSEYGFQSQTRCQAPFGTAKQAPTLFNAWVSISDEMPGPFRRFLHGIASKVNDEFQSQTRCQAPFG